MRRTIRELAVSLKELGWNSEGNGFFQEHNSHYTLQR